MRFSVFKTLLLGAAMVFNSAFADTFKCPHVIKTTQSLLEKVQGWDEFLDEWNIVHSFNGVTFYAGHPSEHASLVQDNEGTKGNQAIWTFGRDKIWFACKYSNTTVQLIQKLPDKTKRCTVTYDSNYSRVTAINCI